MSLRIVLVENDLSRGARLERLLSRTGEYRVVARFASSDSLLESVRVAAGRGRIEWDLVLMNLCLPGLTGIETTAQLKEILPHLQVVVYAVLDTSAPDPKALESPSQDEAPTSSEQELLGRLRAIDPASGSQPADRGAKRGWGRGLKPATLDLYTRLVRRKRP